MRGAPVLGSALDLPTPVLQGLCFVFVAVHVAVHGSAPRFVWRDSALLSKQTGSSDALRALKRTVASVLAGLRNRLWSQAGCAGPWTVRPQDLSARSGFPLQMPVADGSCPQVTCILFPALVALSPQILCKRWSGPSGDFQLLSFEGRD